MGLCISFFQIVLDSDDALFGGFSRLNHAAEYFTSVWNFSKLVSECAPCSGMDLCVVFVLFVFSYLCSFTFLLT